jgi:4-alpha-glucanotransferase
MAATSSFRELDPAQRAALQTLHDDHFYRRQDALWRAHALQTLPPLLRATDMLACGEDLGLVPACLPPVMQELGLLGLRIQRMPSEAGREFADPAGYPYLAVASPSCHDVAPLRAWFVLGFCVGFWGLFVVCCLFAALEPKPQTNKNPQHPPTIKRYEADPQRRERFYYSCLGGAGPPPEVCEPEISRLVASQHLASPSALVVLPVQVRVCGRVRVCVVAWGGVREWRLPRPLLFYARFPAAPQPSQNKTTKHNQKQPNQTNQKQKTFFNQRTSSP